MVCQILKFAIPAGLIVCGYQMQAEVLTQSDKIILQHHCKLTAKLNSEFNKISNLISEKRSLLKQSEYSIDALKNGSESGISYQISALKNLIQQQKTRYKTYKEQYDKLFKRAQNRIVDKADIEELDALYKIYWALRFKKIRLIYKHRKGRNADIQKELKKIEQQQKENEIKISHLEKAGIMSTADLNRLKSLPDKIASLDRKLEYLSRLVKLLEYPKNKRSETMTAMEKAHSGMKEEILDLYEKFKLEKNKIIEPQRFAVLNNKFQNIAQKFIKLPTKDKFKTINRYSVNAWFGSPVIDYRWFFDTSSSGKKQERNIFNGSIKYIPGLHNGKTHRKLFDKYPLFNNLDYKIEFGTGDYLISLHGCGIYSNKEIYPIAVNSLFDLKAIAGATNNLRTERRFTDEKSVIQQHIKLCKIHRNYLHRQHNEEKSKLLDGIDFNLWNQRYQALARKFVRIPDSREYSLLTRYNVSSWLGITRIECKWYTRPYSKYHAILYGYIDYNPDFNPQVTIGKGNSKYPVHILSDNIISLKAGDFVVSLETFSDFYSGKKNLLNTVKQLYDLDSIASITK